MSKNLIQFLCGLVGAVGGMACRWVYGFRSAALKSSLNPDLASLGAERYGRRHEPQTLCNQQSKTVWRSGECGLGKRQVES